VTFFNFGAPLTIHRGKLPHWRQESVIYFVTFRLGDSFDGERYELGEFIVMPNHVHAIVATIGDHQLSPILHSWKSFSAHKFNRILSSSGRIWLPESFDHIVRSAEHLAKFETYIRNNANYLTSLPQ
jgi:REP element-mobilizing transposase RayT